MKARHLVTSALLAGFLMASPASLLAAGQGANGSGGQAARQGTMQQSRLQKRDRLHAESPAPAGDQLQTRTRTRSQTEATTTTAAKAQQRSRTRTGR